MDPYRVVWDCPGRDSSDSMPLGNGELGANIWVEESGDLLFYLSRTDAWSENARLLKLGRVRVVLTPNPLSRGGGFEQVLDMGRGEVLVRAGGVAVRLWVDAHHPVLRVEVESGEALGMEVRLEVWRDRERPLEGGERQSAYGLADAPHPVLVRPDAVVPGLEDRIVWYHRNESSIWAESLQIQGLGAWAGEQADPLLQRTFGGVIRGDGLVGRDARTLVSQASRRRWLFSLHTCTLQSATPLDWVRELGQQAAASDAPGLAAGRRAHRAWWDAFWKRSWVRVGGAPEAEVVTRGYALQRFVSACAGRGAFPVKFNGSLFTVDAREGEARYDADYRRWGGPYWFQNTRLIYWPMLASGDFDMLEPLFRMYGQALPLALERTRIYFGHGGAFFPETMYFWGAYATDNYGWDRRGRAVGQVDNPYIRHYWQAGLELVALMLDYQAYSEETDFVGSALLPMADAVLDFYDQHHGRSAAGKLRLEPAQSLETDQKVVDPLPDLAGLGWVLDRLLELPGALCGEARRHLWVRLRGELPELPAGRIGDEEVLLTAAEVLEEPRNSENPELYAVFPYRLFGVGKAGLERARRTFERRRYKGFNGWRQDDIQAAFLGLAQQAARGLAARFAARHEGSRFPGFWGPNFDWIPDQDHGCNGLMALQTMLLQADGGRLLLFPAWPRAWDVEFRLHAPARTTIEGRYQGGRLEALEVRPPGREKDLVVLEPQ